MASQSRSPSTPAASRALTIEPLTFTGNARDGALSPDGRFVAYVHLDGAEASVWVRQLATQSDVQIVPPVAGRRFVGLSVTPDGNYVDFVVSGPRDLWRACLVLILLGTATHAIGLAYPREVVFDEATMGNFVSAY